MNDCLYFGDKEDKDRKYISLLKEFPLDIISGNPQISWQVALEVALVPLLALTAEQTDLRRL